MKVSVPNLMDKKKNGQIQVICIFYDRNAGLSTHEAIFLVYCSLGKEYRKFGKGIINRMTQSACDTCAYYSYDEDYECYVCDMDLDEDELVRFLSDTHYNCPYYRNGDEYAVVRKQI